MEGKGMNKKKAKKLRRSLMTHDEWVQAKTKRTYQFNPLDSKPRKNQKVLCVTASGQVALGVIKRTHGEDLKANEYEVRIGPGENDIIKIGIEAIMSTRASRVPDKISQYKEAKKRAL
jgi:hypothetical protein